MNLNSSCVLMNATFRHLSRGKYALESVTCTCTLQEKVQAFSIMGFCIFMGKKEVDYMMTICHIQMNRDRINIQGKKCRLFEQGTWTRHPPSALKDIFFLPQTPRQNATWIRGQSSQQVYIESSAKYALTLVTDVSCSFRRQYIYIYFKSRELTKKH